ncbi:MAG: C39 family peptidase [Oscillospiraceae bacterium]|nr:C39 family peptidase [Oscillospiraceae bacterium]
MKQKITAMLMTGIMTLAAVPAGLPAVRVQAKDETMPAAFVSEPNRAYSKPCRTVFESVPAPLLALVPEEDATRWMQFNDTMHAETPETLIEYTNIYSFIMSFGLSDEEVRTVMLKGIDEQTVFITETELDLILTASEKDILNYFATDYVIIIGEKFYTPQWLYEHTTEEYAAAGITPDMIAAKLGTYPDFPFTLEASVAFSEKLYSYVGSSAGLINWAFTPGDVDMSGDVGILDIIKLQRYLLKVENIGYANWVAADLNGDNDVDIMDLALLKREMLVKFPPEPIEEPTTEPVTEPVTEQPTEPPTEPYEERPIEVILNVMEYNQHPNYPTGCESVALYMLLKYYGTDVTVEQIVNALPKASLPYTKNGLMYGPDPNKYFVGDPRNSSSYGVFNEPIAQVAEQFRPGVQCKTGAPLEDVIDILDSGNPAQVWYTTNPERGIVYRREWYLDTGELFRWPGGEHAVVVCGHDQTTLTYRDPNTGGTVVKDIEEFRKIYDELGGRIVYYNE